MSELVRLALSRENQNGDLGNMLAQLHGLMNHGAAGSEDRDHNLLSFIPETLRSPVLLMKAEPLQTVKMVTCFLGTVSDIYKEETWKKDVEQWKQHFGLQQFYEIKFLPELTPEGTPSDRMNARDAIRKIEDALKILNQVPGGHHIRVVRLGTGYAHFLYEAVMFLLKEWQKPDGTVRTEKHIQFVTSGDTKKSDLCNFCRWLCVSGICTTIEFFNTQEYHPFGYCSSNFKSKPL